MPDNPVLLEVDGRRRVSLGALARHDRYLVTAETDGTIVLTPAVVMPAVQARLLAAPETSAGVGRFLNDPSTGTRRPPPGCAHGWEDHLYVREGGGGGAAGG